MASTVMLELVDYQAGVEDPSNFSGWTIDHNKGAILKPGKLLYKGREKGPSSGALLMWRPENHSFARMKDLVSKF